MWKNGEPNIHGNGCVAAQSVKTHEELKELHGEDYALRFERGQLPVRLERLKGHIKLHEWMSVADFGCGSGLLAEHIASKVRRYVGVDFSSAFIDRARRRAALLGISNAEFVCCEITNFCHGNLAQFDAAFAMDFSEHVYDQEWMGILAAIRSSLKKGGEFYLHTPNANFFLEIMKKHNFIVRQFPEHVAVRTAAQNVTLIKQAGFSVDKVMMLPHYNVLRHLHFLFRLPLLGPYFEARIFIRARNA
jgi:cyclopropane fatty-acyl-phospholipid synthase-like methyltransferase